MALALESASSCTVGVWGSHKRGRGMVREKGRGWMGRDMGRRELGRGRGLGRKCGGGSGTW